MGAAEDAYAAAVAEIERVRAAGRTELDFNELRFRALTRLPPEIAKFETLQRLDLDNTQVADITPLAGLTALQALGLGSTQVADITPLAGLTALQALGLDGTQVADITPLAGLTALQMLELENTPLADLRALRDLAELGATEQTGLWFRGIPALRDPELARLSAIEDDQTRTRETLAYLRTLPPWPEPLPWEGAAKEPPSRDDGPIPEPVKPPRRPAPLQVAFVDGQLREVGVGSGLPDDAVAREVLGRAALSEYLADFDDEQMKRIENVLPRLGKAMARLAKALEAGDAFNPIAAGMQGDRVLRLSQGATDRLLDDDGDDVAHFAAQVALYLDRFLVWTAYKADATPELVPVEEIRDALPEFHSVHAMLEEADWASPQVADAYGAIVAEMKEAQGDPLAARGLQDATREAVSEIVNEALAEAKDVKTSGLWAEYRTELRKGAIKTVVAGTIVTATGTGGVVLDAVFLNAALLQSLAMRFPTTYAYVLDALKYLGIFV